MADLGKLEAILEFNTSQLSAGFNAFTEVLGKMSGTLDNLQKTIDETGKRMEDAFEKAAAAVKKPAKPIDETADKLKNAKNKSNELLAAFKKLGVTMSVAFAVRTMANFAKESVVLASKIEGVTRAFRKMSSDSVKVLHDLQKATMGTTDNLTLMSRAVRAGQLGIDIQNMAKYFEFATKRSLETGESVDYLVDSIVNGIGRKSILKLDNLGISVERIRREVGRTGEFSKAMAKIVDEELAMMGDTLETTAVKIQRVGASWTNVKIRLGEVIVQYTTLDSLLKVVSATLDSMTGKGKMEEFASAQSVKNTEELFDELQKMVVTQTALNEAASKLDKTWIHIAKIIMGTSLAGMISVKMMDLQTAKTNEQVQIIYDTISARVKEADAMGDISSIEDDLTAKLQQMNKLLRDNAFEVEGTTRLNADQIKSWNALVEKLEGILQRQKNLTKAAEDYKNTIKGIQENVKKLNEDLAVTNIDDVAALSELYKKIVNEEARLRKASNLKQTIEAPVTVAEDIAKQKGAIEATGKMFGKALYDPISAEISMLEGQLNKLAEVHGTNITPQMTEIADKIKSLKIEKIGSDVEREFNMLEVLAAVLGDSFDLAGSKADVLEGKLKEIANTTGGEVTPEIQKLNEDLRTQEKIKVSDSITKGLAEIALKASYLGDQYDAAAAKVKLYESAANNAIETSRGLEDVSGYMREIQQAKIQGIWDDYNKGVKEANALHFVMQDTMTNLNTRISLQTALIEKLTKEYGAFSIEVAKAKNDLDAMFDQKSMVSMAQSLTDIANEAALVGETFNEAAAQAEVYKKAFLEAAASNKYTTEELAAMKQQYLEAKEAGDMFSANMQAQTMLAQGLVNAFNDFGAALANGEDPAKAFALAMMDALQNVINMYLMMAIAGQIASASKWGMIGLAIAAAAIGAVKALFASSTAGLAQGGIIPGGYSNDTFPAMLSSNEAVIPLNRLKSIVGIEDRQMGNEVTFRIDGTTLVGVLDRQGRKTRLMR